METHKKVVVPFDQFNDKITNNNNFELFNNAAGRREYAIFYSNKSEGFGYDAVEDFFDVQGEEITCNKSEGYNRFPEVKL